VRGQLGDRCEVYAIEGLDFATKRRAESEGEGVRVEGEG